MEVLEYFERGMPVEALAADGTLQKVMVDELVGDLVASQDITDTDRAFLIKTSDGKLLLHRWLETQAEEEQEAETLLFGTEEELASHLWKTPWDAVNLRLLWSLGRLELKRKPDDESEPAAAGSLSIDSSRAG